MGAHNPDLFGTHLLTQGLEDADLIVQAIDAAGAIIIFLHNDVMPFGLDDIP